MIDKTFGRCRNAMMIKSKIQSPKSNESPKSTVSAEALAKTERTKLLSYFKLQFLTNYPKQ